MWCSNAGHNREPIVEAIRAEALLADYVPPFQFANPKAFALASRISALAPGDLDHVFFCNSGSEAADTALKIALAYWVANGQGQRTRFVAHQRDALIEAHGFAHADWRIWMRNQCRRCQAAHRRIVFDKQDANRLFRAFDANHEPGDPSTRTGKRGALARNPDRSAACQNRVNKPFIGRFEALGFSH
jgi:hypothetical protein